MREDIIYFYQHMKSIAINVCQNESGDDYLPNIESLISWLEEYDQWFKSQVGISEGEHAYALYNRQVTIFGDNLLKVPNTLRKLAQTVIPMGFALSITVDIMELYQEYETVKALCEDCLLSSIGFCTDNVGKLSVLTDLESFIIRIAELKRPIGLIGSVSELRKYDLLSKKTLNSTDITLYPQQYEDRIGCGSVYPYVEKSCANHLQLYISPDGYIYSCLGLLGLKNYAISNIRDGIESFNLTGDKSKIDLLKLYRQGPEIQEKVGYHQSDTSLPYICEMHRMELLKDA